MFNKSADVRVPALVLPSLESERAVRGAAQSILDDGGARAAAGGGDAGGAGHCGGDLLFHAGDRAVLDLHTAVHSQRHLRFQGLDQRSLQIRALNKMIQSFLKLPMCESIDQYLNKIFPIDAVHILDLF